MKKRTRKTFDTLLSEVVQIEKELKKLPPLSVTEKATLDHSRAIEHLYYSSKIEGTHLTEKRIDKAIYGQELSPTEG